MLAESNLRKLPKYNQRIMLDIPNVLPGKACEVVCSQSREHQTTFNKRNLFFLMKGFVLL